MLNAYAYRLFLKDSDNESMQYVAQQVSDLLQQGHCALINSIDYQLEAAASAINGLTDDHETADIYLYAAIERNDWQTVTDIYKTVFRPHLYEYATRSVIKALHETSEGNV